MAHAMLDSLPIPVDTGLVNAVIESVQSALTMCDVKTRCVGISSVPSREMGLVSGMIGVYGKVSGFVTVNMSDKLALRLVNGLLQDNFNELTTQVVDGAGEITNIIVGGIKGALAGGPMTLSHITVPSVIVGGGYQIAFAKGLEFLRVTFEHVDSEALMLNDRILTVCVTLLRL